MGNDFTDTFVDLDTSAAQSKLAWLKGFAQQLAGTPMPLSPLPSGRSPDARATGYSAVAGLTSSALGTPLTEPTT